MTKPLTQRFRDLYALGSMWPKWLRFLWLGMVVWFEGHYLHYLVIQEQRVTEAIQRVADGRRTDQSTQSLTAWNHAQGSCHLPRGLTCVSLLRGLVGARSPPMAPPPARKRGPGGGCVRVCAWLCPDHVQSGPGQPQNLVAAACPAPLRNCVNDSDAGVDKQHT
jgi:hypothetical protein